MDRPRRPPSEPSSNSARARRPAAYNSAAPTTAQPTDTTTKKPLPAHVVRIPGNNYEYTVNVDGVDYKTVSAFYCTLCHAQLHATSIEMHISSKKHKAKLGADQDDVWEDESRPSASLSFAGESTQSQVPLSQFQRAGYLGQPQLHYPGNVPAPATTAAPPPLPIAPAPSTLDQPAPLHLQQPQQTIHQPLDPISTTAQQTAPQPRHVPPPQPILQTAVIQFPPQPFVGFNWTEDQITALFNNSLFRARLEEFVNRIFSVAQPATSSAAQPNTRTLLPPVPPPPTSASRR